MKTASKVTTFSAICLMAFSSLGSAQAYSSGSSAGENNLSISSSVGSQLSNTDRENLILIAEGLKEGPAERDVEKTANGENITYHLQDKIDITFSYNKEGKPVIPILGDNGGKAMVPYVSAGFDPFPYIDLDPSEQGAAASGLAGTIGGLICAALAGETAGLGCIAAAGIAATIVSVAVSHGVCPDNRTLRIHLSGAARCL